MTAFLEIDNDGSVLVIRSDSWIIVHRIYGDDALRIAARWARENGYKLTFPFGSEFNDATA